MVKCGLSMRVYSTAAGYAGNWSYTLEINLAAVPVPGMWICWRDGWESLYVKDVTLGLGPDVLVEIQPVKTDDPQRVQELDSMCQHGWQKHGGPWKGQ